MINLLHTRGEQITNLLNKHKEKYSNDKMEHRVIESRAEISKWLKPYEEAKKIDSFFLYLKFNMEKIITGEPKALNEIVNDINIQFNKIPFKAPKQGEQESLLHKHLKKIFDYNNFCSAKRWGAYKLVNGLNIRVCPYCNCQYTPFIETEGGRVRATLDHFYDKGTYPFLALSFYNLIPSCYVCNSSLKNRKEFSVDTHVHPYSEGFDDYVKFSIDFIENREDIDYTKILNGDIEVFKIDFINIEGNDDQSFYEKAERNIKDFKLREIYALHKDYVAELILKAEIYNDDFINILYQNFSNIFSNKQEILRVITSNYTEINEIEKRVLSKLTRDVSNQLGILQKIY